MIGYDKEGNEYKIVDTKQCQINSVIAFMAVLGFNYTPNEFIHEAPGFYNVHENKAFSRLSFATATYLHNGRYEFWEIGSWKSDHFRLGDSLLIPVGDILSANKAKIVEVAKLQYSRKNKKIICQNHMVTFTSTENQALYLGEV